MIDVKATGSYCEVCGGVCVASVPSGQRASVESELAELKRYRDLDKLRVEGIELLHARLDRVKALPAKWRREYDDNCEACAVDLERALSGEW